LIAAVIRCGAQAPESPPAYSPAEEAFAGQLSALPLNQALKEIAAADASHVTEGLYRALREMALPLADADPQRALPIFRETEAVATRAGLAILAADAHGNTARAMDGMGDPSGSLALWEETLSMYAAAMAPRRKIVAIHLNRAATYIHLGDSESAVADDDEALRISRETGDEVSVARADNGLGNALRDEARFNEAEAAYTEALHIARLHGEKMGEAFVLNNLSVLHSIEGNYPLALRFCEQSLEIKRQVGSPASVGGTLINLANYYDILGRDADANRALTEAAQIGRQLNYLELTAKATAQMGIIQLEKHHTQEALVLLQQGRELGKDVEDNEGRAMTIRKMAEGNFDLKQYRQALELSQEAAGIARRGNMLNEISGAALVEGSAYLELGQLPQARTALEESIDAIEQMRNNVGGGATERQRFMKDRTEPYRLLALVEAMQGEWSLALNTADRGKGRILLDIFTGNGLGANGALTDAERREEDRLRSSFLSVDMKFDRLTSSPGYDPSEKNELDAEIQNARAQLAGYREELYKRHPDLRLRRADFSALTPQDLQKLVPDRATALLEYELTPQANYLFVVTRGEADSAKVSGYKLAISSAELSRHVRHYREQLASRDPEFAAEARWLYAALLQPAQAQLANIAAVAIAPDGVMWDVPFQALQRRDGRYLVESMAIDYVPSLAVLHALKSAAPSDHGARTLLAMGNPGGKTREQAVEASAVGKLYGQKNSQTFLGKSATLDRFLKDSATFDVVHLAAHGIYDDREPMASHMFLASQDRQAQAGWLRAREIQSMQLHAELVVLSGCETGRGSFEDGEGLVGMSWAMLAAGARGSLASAWRVEADSTTEMMLAFHRSMLLGMNKAEALRRAELKVLHTRDSSHPFYWAAFVLVGDGTS
jgi:CHAT domain-containing protein